MRWLVCSVLGSIIGYTLGKQGLGIMGCIALGIILFKMYDD